MSDKSPDAFRTISEVADWLGVQPHVLRFWESKFTQVKPVKRAGGRRYYRPTDMMLLGGIRQLLHEDGLTIKGAQKVLCEKGVAHVSTMSQPLDPESAALINGIHEPDADEVAETAADAPTTELPSFMAAEPAAEPAPMEPAGEELATAEPIDAPEPVTEESVATEDAPAELPSFLTSEPATAASDTPETELADESTAPEIPSFMRSARSDAPAEPEPPAEPTPPEPSEDVVAAEVFDEAPPPPAPKPRVVDIPDPDPATFSSAPAALSAAFKAAHLTAAERAQITPLVARLAALRDTMLNQE